MKYYKNDIKKLINTSKYNLFEICKKKILTKKKIFKAKINNTKPKKEIFLSDI
jgi:hypothetical protein